jgi:PAS domain S-box-containing protein
MWNIGAVLYAVALFGFRMFDPIPLANQTVIAQMHTGMLVVDSRGQVISLNPAAQTLLGVPARQAVGQPVRTWLPWAAADGTPPARERDEIEIQWGQAPDIRHYRLEKTVLKDWRGQAAGCLVLLHDVTRQKQAQARLVEQQRALATLDERERLARELHDTIGQLLGYVGFQVDAVSKLVLDGESDVAMAQLGRLGEMVRAAHADVREQILDLHTAPAPEQPFFVVIGQYLDGFTHNYNIQTRLLVEDPFGAEPFSPDARMQVLRILQEALSNARKHGRARRVEVSFGWEDQQVRMVVQDDGAGFDSSRSMAENEGHFGLRFMRERAEALGGRLEVTSEPDQGTRVVVWAPRQAAVLLPESEVDHA